MDTKQRQFSLSDASKVAGITEKSFRNWLSRGALDLGKREVNRWEFSAQDIVALRVVADLAALGDIPTSVSTDAASCVKGLTASYARNTLRREARLAIYLSNTVRCIGELEVSDDGDLVLTRGGKSVPNSRPVIYIPVYDLIADVMDRLDALLEGRRDS